MAQGTQHSADDPRNADILIWVNGALKPREQAVVSVFDSGFVLGDGVWEGFRVAAWTARNSPTRSCTRWTPMAWTATASTCG